MLRSATSYLWGSSSTTEKAQEQKSPHTETPKHHSHSHSTTSLPDLDELNLDEKELTHYNRHNSIASQSIAQLSYNNNYPQFKTPAIDIILDKESKYKLSATSNISFLFNKPIVHNRSNCNLSRYPYFIASNRNANYINKMDHILKTQHKEEEFNGDATSKQPIIQETETKLDINDINDTATDTKLSSSILSIVNVKDLNQYLDSLNLTKEEKKGILTLCEWVKTEKLSIKLCEEMWMAEIIITYFSSLSPTNPDLFGCWKRWIMYRSDHGLLESNLNTKRIKQFFDTGIFSIGFDNQRRPVWFINTEHYDDSFGVDVITKASVLWVSSLLWNLSKNEFDLFALRRGLSVYVNLSHWSINMASWSILQSVKKALVAYPYYLVDIYVVNIPTFMYLLKQLASKIVVPHAMEKFKILPDTNDYFENYAPKHTTPICAGGTLKVSATQWMKDRGFLDYVEPPTKHNKSPSSPISSSYE